MYKEWLKKSMTGKKLMKTGITVCMCVVFVNGALDTMVSAYDKGENDVSEIVDSVQPSMVAVNTQPVTEVQKFYERYGFSFYSDTMDVLIEGSCSGVIVGKNKEELLIVTNYHRINESEVITITTQAGDSFQGELKGYDDQQDIAIVSVPITEVDNEAMEELNVATLGSYDDLKIGEQVIALGNALGYGQSATTGIVSAKDQRIEMSECTCDNTLNLIQTDAAVHPGNTGGALVNMNGELIGIISTELNSSGFDGIGYAISVSDVTAMIESLTYEEDTEDAEYESHGSLGLEGVTVSDEVNILYGIPAGVYVKSITKDGALAQAGIKENYIITSFDGIDISSADQLDELLLKYLPGEEIEIIVMYLENGDYITEMCSVTLEDSIDEEITIIENFSIEDMEYVEIENEDAFYDF